MRQLLKRWQMPAAAALTLALAALGLVLYSGNLLKIVAALTGALAVWMVVRHDPSPLRLPFAWTLPGYVLFAGLTAFWTITGKLTLESFLQLFAAACVFVIVLLRVRQAPGAARRVMALITATAGLYAFLSVEAATTGRTTKLFDSLLHTLPMGEFHSRLWGVFGNPNIEATIFAYGVFFSVALLCDARSGKERALYAFSLSSCAFSMLLGFSMGAIACFLVSILCYLIFAGTWRVSALTHMLNGALPSVAFSFAASGFFGRAGFMGKLPLLLLLLNAACCALLELRLSGRFIVLLERRQKLVFGFPICVIVLAALYIAIAVSVHTPYTFGRGIARPLYPSAGEHTLVVGADGETTVTIVSRTRDDILLVRRAKPVTLYSGADTAIRFTVPEGSAVCTFSFSAGEGVTLRSAELDGKQSVPLRYPLLPDFILSRIQGLRVNTNAMLRREMANDALKLWRMRPIAGNGLGAFEAGAQMVQYAPYKTKYAHDHYAQTLSETGVIGLALWLAALLSPPLALWRRRRDTEHPFRWAYGAFWAATVMVVAQSATDVLFSFVVALWYVFSVFALIFGVYGGAAAAEAETADGRSKKQRREAEKARKTADRVTRAAVVLPVAIFLLTLLGVAEAEAVNNRAAYTVSERLENLERAAKLDVYNTTDYQFTYLVTTMREMPNEEQRAKADRYAGNLMNVHSYAVPGWVESYYLGSGQYAKAVETANYAAVNCAKNQQVWFQMASQLRVAFDRVDTPLLFQPDCAELLAGMAEFHRKLEAHNAETLIPIDIGAENEAFFAKVLRANEHPDDPAHIFTVFSA